MLEPWIRRVRRGSHQREVVEKVARSEILGGLGDDLGTFHGLPVPERSSVLKSIVAAIKTYVMGIITGNWIYDCDLDTLGITRIGRIFEVG